jgi:tetratricopeptide (TPR) repeat protein
MGILILFVLNFKNLRGRKILTILLVITVVFAGLFLKRNSESLKESLFFRNYVWRGTINIILNNPAAGTGPGSFSVVFPKYRPYELMKWTYEHSYEVHYPENIFLQVGSGTGVTGLLLFVFVLCLIFKSGRLSPPEYSAGLAAILVTNFFGVDINYAPSMLLFIVISGMMLKNDKNYFSVNPFYARLILIFTMTFLAFVSAFWINRHISGIYTKRGVYFSKSGDFKNAIENYKTALKFYDKNTEALYFMGSSYYDSGNPEDALKIFEYLEKSAPNYVLLHYKIAKIHNDMGLYDDAIEEYKKMLKIDPYLKEALVELAYIYYNKKNMFDEAEKCMLKAIEKYKDDPALYSNLGNIYFMEKKYNEAIECFKKSIEIKEDKDYYYNLGCVYFIIHDFKNAELCLKKAERMAPLDEKIRHMLQTVEKYGKITDKK